MTPDGDHAGAQRRRVARGWQLCATAAGQYAGPDQLAADPLRTWISIPEATTVAAALRAVGQWSLDGAARRFDSEDWWFQADVELPDDIERAGSWLVFDGLAGVADVWLNETLLFCSTSMFVAREVEIGSLSKPGTNRLTLRFHALDALLAQRRPRPRWRAPMVEHQQLRWFRTTLLGRTPGWSPPAAPVGPWRDVWLERRGERVLGEHQLRSVVTPDGSGELHFSGHVGGPTGNTSVELELQRGPQTYRAALTRDAATDGAYKGVLKVPAVDLWWPHTHGTPALYSAHLLVQGAGASQTLRVPLKQVGFRTVEVDTSDSGFSVRVNGEPVFCRGACWTPLDVVSLRADSRSYRAAVEQVCRAGMNMLRVVGTMVYEDAAFFDACDALGVMVWQDFMFANMDYPAGDASFMADVQAEVSQQLTLWQARPSLTVVCGNSEVEQQAAMWGAARELWQPALFHETLAARVRDALPDVPYWPSSAHGGAFPHQSSAGTSSYYGVGAYLRPQDDARRADLRFATECLAFANVPEDSTIARMPGGLSLRVHHPGWKARTPRDLGAGWDFEDVRDHYLAELFGVDPAKCRSTDPERYLTLSRAVPGALMSAAFAEWRRAGSRCGGALVLMLRDLWAGAGWGLLDDTGSPKACFFQLARALQPVALAITDEGGNGLVAHLSNERVPALAAQLQISLYGPGDALVSRTLTPVHLQGRAHLSVPLVEGLEHFLDLSYAYRFGPPPVTLVHAQLLDEAQSVVAETHFLPVRASVEPRLDIGLTAEVVRDGGGVALEIGSERFAHTVHIAIDGHVPADNYFHLAPGGRRRVALRPITSTEVIKGQVSSLNASRAVSLYVSP